MSGFRPGGSGPAGKVRIAVSQCGSVLFDTPATIARLRDAARQAAQAGAQFVLFPEAFLGGYPKSFDFGVKLGQRSEAGRDLFARYFASAINVGSSNVGYASSVSEIGPEVSEVQAIARECQLFLATGAIERAGDTLYCAFLLFGPDGSLIGQRRKLQPTAFERVLWGAGTARDITSWETPLGRIAGVICWENYMPLFRAAMYGQGTRIYCAPTVDDRETWLPTLRHIAVEGRCFVLSSCQYLTLDDVPADLRGQLSEADRAKPALIRGGSAIIDPFGRVIAGPVFDQTALLTADIDLDEIVRGKFDLDVAGHYARDDLFNLKIAPLES